MASIGTRASLSEEVSLSMEGSLSSIAWLIEAASLSKASLLSEALLTELQNEYFCPVSGFQLKMSELCILWISPWYEA